MFENMRKNLKKSDNERLHDLLDMLEKLQASTKKTLRHIQAMAGHPDAAEGCRNIIAFCEEQIKQLEDGSNSKI